MARSTCAAIRHTAFGALGAGFMLLETKAIGDCTLFFGTTWLVTMIVVTGVLLMVFASNFVATFIDRFSPTWYVPLFVLLLLTCFVPREHLLAYSFPVRVGWTLLVVPLPVFFAGLIFSTNFRAATDPSALFGANLIGAMVGGFSEYLTMAIGSQRISALLLVAYGVSLVALLRSRRVGA